MQKQSFEFRVTRFEFRVSSSKPFGYTQGKFLTSPPMAGLVRDKPRILRDRREARNTSPPSWNPAGSGAAVPSPRAERGFTE